MINLDEPNYGLPALFPHSEEPEVAKVLNYLLYNGAYIGDYFIMLKPAFNFILQDKKFNDAIERNACPVDAKTILWRIHANAWAAKHCLNIEGDFVECGTHRALISSTIVNYLDFAKVDKTFYLYDTFDGIPEKIINDNPETARLDHSYYHDPNLYQNAVNTFKDFPNVKVIKGALPEILESDSPQRIAFLNIDLGNYPSVKATLDSLYDRISSGGIIVIQGYGRKYGYNIDQLAADKLFNNLPVLELISGQGIIIKP